MEAAKVFAYTKSVGGMIAATEFMNEPNAASMGGAPKGYDVAEYGKDVTVFKTFLAEHSAKTSLLGPGSVGEGGVLSMPGPGIIPSTDLLSAAGAACDAFSFHVYPAVSIVALRWALLWARPPLMLSQRNGWLGPKQSRPTTQACVTSSILGSRSGSLKLLIVRAAVILGINLPGYVSIPEPTRHDGTRRRTGRHAQYA